MHSTTKLIIIGIIPFAIAACGGSATTSLQPESNFTRWGAITANTEVIVGGVDIDGSYQWDSVTDKITSTSMGAASEGATYSATYDSSGKLLTAVIAPSGGTAVSFDSSIDTIGSLVIDSATDMLVSANGKNYALAPNPTTKGWDYQSYGTWVTGGGTGSGTAGVMSVGAKTTGANIPLTGTAVYRGNSGGRYVDTLGNYVFTHSDIYLAADFSRNAVDFESYNTKTTADLINIVDRTDLDFETQLSYSAATNSLTGDNIPRGRRGLSDLTGTVTGRFYGPSAEEIGGVFKIDKAGADTILYSAAFGGKQ